MKQGGLHLKMMRCAVELLVVGEKSEVKLLFFVSRNATCESLTDSVFSLLGGRLHKYGEVFKFYDSLYFHSIV